MYGTAGRTPKRYPGNAMVSNVYLVLKNSRNVLFVARGRGQMVGVSCHQAPILAAGKKAHPANYLEF